MQQNNHLAHHEAKGKKEYDKYKKVGNYEPVGDFPWDCVKLPELTDKILHTIKLASNCLKSKKSPRDPAISRPGALSQYSHKKLQKH